MTVRSEHTRRVDAARARFARVAFANYLGVSIGELGHDRAVLVLPYRPEHLNPSGTLNGGAGASLLTMAGTLAAWTGLDLDAEPNPRVGERSDRAPIEAFDELRCVDLSVLYLGRTTEEEVVAEARVLRRGRNVVFLDVAVRARDGRPVCHGLLTYHASDRAGRMPRLHAEHAPLPAPAPLIPPADHRLFHGYVNKLDVTPVHVSPGRSRLEMPCTPMHVDERGHLHAGTLASIVDIAAVTASWALVPRRPGSRGSTIGMQVSFPGAASERVVADALVQQRSEELLFSTVHVTTVSGQLVALGQVSYRLLEPWPDGSKPATS
jgi:uncharacterized protein (TIGR00369 family)